MLASTPSSSLKLFLFFGGKRQIIEGFNCLSSFSTSSLFSY